jgi:hypothetical protein
MIFLVQGMNFLRKMGRKVMNLNIKKVEKKVHGNEKIKLKEKLSKKSHQMKLPRVMGK